MEFKGKHQWGSSESFILLFKILYRILTCDLEINRVFMPIEVVILIFIPKTLMHLNILPGQETILLQTEIKGLKAGLF